MLWCCFPESTAVDSEHPRLCLYGCCSCNMEVVIGCSHKTSFAQCSDVLKYYLQYIVHLHCLCLKKKDLFFFYRARIPAPPRKLQHVQERESQACLSSSTPSSRSNSPILEVTPVSKERDLPRGFQSPPSSTPQATWPKKGSSGSISVT